MIWPDFNHDRFRIEVIIGLRLKYWLILTDLRINPDSNYDSTVYNHDRFRIEVIIGLRLKYWLNWTDLMINPDLNHDSNGL